ncbi:hypothetical protein LK09_14190 [Microbacterium mangrovi]|uniref:PASTA domain-containing protein n=1 Tax=Microbacterium mangrovi TaxID=1348253 RepID=A0A0B1ZZQ7_9MICO|nr:transglycosylase domain-containing protein [Microbacterium mangrovi]KHK96705.1 hypothetical protein LK09_14190 [Microbacterium mangrovi]
MSQKRTVAGVLGGLFGLVGLSVLAGILVTVLVTPAVTVTSSAATRAITLFEDLPSALTIDKISLPSTLYYQNPTTHQEVVLAKFYDQNRSPVKWGQIAPVMYDAILSSEDKRFYEHGGVDPVGTTSALISNITGRSSRGGSSISQQYVKNVLIQQCDWNATGNSVDAANRCWQQAAGVTGTAGIQRKIQEMRYAIALEQKYSKNEILLGYLNIALFGGTTYGINAAAKYYFGVPASKLTLARAAILAGMVQNPNTYRIDLPGGTATVNGKAVNGKNDKIALVQVGDHYDMVDPASAPKDAVKITGYSLTKQRELYVLGQMLKDGKITQKQYNDAAIAPIVPKITQPSFGCAYSVAPYYCQYVRNTILADKAFGATATDRGRMLQKGGLKVYTTLDPRVQKAAQDAQDAYVPTHVSYMRLGSTSVSLQSTTGRVLAIAQNTKYSDTSNKDGYQTVIYAGDAKNGASGGFNAGSTFKLFTLLTWLKDGHPLNEIVNGNHQSFFRWHDSCLPRGRLIEPTGYQPGNFQHEAGRFGTPLEFTKISLNSGFWAMAHELDLCEIGKTAASLGVTLGDGAPIPLSTSGGKSSPGGYPSPYEVLGSDNVSPLAMAAAYATIANKGIHCQPKVIDRVTDAGGTPLPIPKTTCTQVIAPKIAATAAYALKGPMSPGGTGALGNPNDGTELIGKTGTHQSFETWLDTSSTAVTTANWVGAWGGISSDTNSAPRMDLHYYRGTLLWNIRYALAHDIQGAIDKWYPGGSFPPPDPKLTGVGQKSVPNVVGMSVGDAIQALLKAGFGWVISAPVSSGLPAGTIAQQDPAPGVTSAGRRVTISPSDGSGAASGGGGNGNGSGNGGNSSPSPSPSPSGTGDGHGHGHGGGHG